MKRLVGNQLINASILSFHISGFLIAHAIESSAPSTLKWTHSNLESTDFPLNEFGIDTCVIDSIDNMYSLNGIALIKTNWLFVSTYGPISTYLFATF